MAIFFGVVVFIFGAIIGSFLNVVILRYKTGRTIGGRSFCFSCGKTLRVLELVPILSFLILRGKCASCKSRVSLQYPLVEAVTGLIFLLVYLKSFYLLPFLPFPLLSFSFYCLVFSILTVVSVYDIRHKIVPDFLSFLFGTVALIWLLGTHDSQYFISTQGIFDLLAGPILFIPFFLLWFLSDGRWMGLGDGKLAVGIGWLLGFTKSVSAIILGFWIAAGVSLLMIGLQRFFVRNLPNLSSKTEVPLAPFLALGAFLAYYFELDLMSLNILLFGTT